MSTQPRRSKASIAAYLFMPQFHLSFVGLRSMGPIFVRTFAIVLAQMGLIDSRHPALGFSEELLREQSVAKLLGEAWFNIRTKNASVTQWGMFISIVLMFCAMIAALIMFLASVVFNVGSAVQAQVFTSPNNPYGAGVGMTDIDTMRAALGTPTGIFDLRISGANVSVDYALMVLDKALRQGAMGVGGAAQNAFGSLMLAYNTAVLTIAGIILFWLILSVVVDTAKTGQIGGGRHNMVWAPIRIVFALGLMIPLGSVGFSSGQFMVMKLAEMGSSLATYGWTQYITSMVTDDSLLGNFMPKNPSEIVRGLTQITTCQAANNFYTKEATVGFGAADNLNYSGYVLSNSSALIVSNYFFGKTTVIYDKRHEGSFGASHDGTNFCGTLEFDNPAVMNISQLPLAAGIGNMTAFRNVLIATNNAMKGALAEILTEGSAENSYNAAYPGGAQNLLKQARALSCSYLRTAIPAPFPQGMNTIPQCLGVANNACGSEFNPAAKTRRYPDMTCVNGMIDTIKTRMTTAFNTAKTTHMMPYINANIITPQRERGWAGMGIFFFQIAKLNEIIGDMEAPMVAYTPGYYTTGNLPGTLDFFFSPSSAEHDAKVMQMSILFTQWWKSASNIGGRGVDYGRDPNAQISVSEEDDEPKKEKGSYVSRKIAAVVKDALSGLSTRDLFSNTAKDPLVQLIFIGKVLVTVAGTFTIVLTVLGAVIGYWIGGMWSPLLDLFYLLCKTLLVSGLVLTVWLPIVPLIRVGMAILTWIVSVFEAVVMVPIAALAHLTTEGEGLAGPAKQVWYLWLSVLMRPVLTVIGFVGSFLLFNAFVLYFNVMFFESLELMDAVDGTEVIMWAIKKMAYFCIYCFIVYTVANTCFKLIDQIPNALAKWIGGHGDPSFDDKNDSAMIAAMGAIKGVGMGNKNDPSTQKSADKIRDKFGFKPKGPSGVS